MREIDDRYPEYARPYCPLGRTKRGARLTGNEATLLAVRRAERLNLMRKYFTTGAVTLIVKADSDAQSAAQAGNLHYIAVP